MPRPAFNFRVQHTPNRHQRVDENVELFGLHTQQGASDAFGLANYCCKPSAGVSYALIVDNAVNVIELVPEGWASWSVGNANNQTYNLCFAGSFAEWSRDEWLEKMGRAIEVAAFLFVERSPHYRVDKFVRSWDEIRAGKSGYTDHRGINEAFLRVKGHTDCGPFFPWDVFAEHVRRFREEGLTDAPAAPPVNLINETRKANEWLGERVAPAGPLDSVEEFPTADGQGRYVEFDAGFVIWKGGTPAAYAVPRLIHETWGDHGHEAGRLGYPTGVAISIAPYTRSNGREVPAAQIQTFATDDGVTRTIYRELDKPKGYVVEGTIRALYASLGYEGGDLGYPHTNEMPNRDGVTQIFRHGFISWHSRTNTAYAYNFRGDPIYPVVPAPPAEPAEGGTVTAPAQAQRVSRPELVGKQLVDYSAGVPSAVALRDAGFVGAVRYTSDAREDSKSWMKGKPITKDEADNLLNLGMAVASNYQYNKGGNATSDWTVPSDGEGDARRGLELHKAAGGPDNAPIYVSIDSNPTRWMYENLVRPYLQNWLKVLPNERLGVYANGWVIDWLIADGIGSYYWQHNWSSTEGLGAYKIGGVQNGHHPAAHLHQIEIDRTIVAGVKVDRNLVLKPDFGAWK